MLRRKLRQKEFGQRRRPFEQRLTREGYLDRAMSVSFMASLSPLEHERARAELLALVADRGHEIVLPYRTDVHWCERIG